MKSDFPAEVTAAEGEEEFTLPCSVGGSRAVFGSEVGGAPRIRLKLFRRVKDNGITGKVWFGPMADGPPEHAHGGATAYVMDEVMGSTAWINKCPGVAAELKVNYHKMVPLKMDHFVESWVEKKDPKKIFLKSHIKNANGEILVSGTAVFVGISKEKLQELFDVSGETDFSVDDFEFAE